jgi:hypothetical protein
MNEHELLAHIANLESLMESDSEDTGDCELNDPIPEPVQETKELKRILYLVKK